MRRRLASSGFNYAVLITAVVVFLGAFLALNALAAAQKPPQVSVLAAAQDLPIGAVLTAADLLPKTVYADENTALYILTEEVDEVLGGVTSLPAAAGQPLFRTAVIAPVGEGTRLAAALSEYPDHSLFPLPLEAANVVAPAADAFMPGDLIGVTVVIGLRPPPPVTPTPAGGAFTVPGPPTPLELTAFPLTPGPALTTTLQLPLLEMEAEEAEALERAAPPLAKDLFPRGVRVVAVQGLPPAARKSGAADANPNVFAQLPQTKMLLLLVPNAVREQLALGLQRADRVFVYLLVSGEGTVVTPGFTYWDFEDLFQADRAAALDQQAGVDPTAVGP